uniref:Uncharacterized protein n=1 Tax=Cyprinus carpio carpio TaxID=630221 RepID=A0A9J7YVU5_CYPCA
ISYGSCWELSPYCSLQLTCSSGDAYYMTQTDSRCNQVQSVIYLPIIKMLVPLINSTNESRHMQKLFHKHICLLIGVPEV